MTYTSSSSSSTDGTAVPINSSLEHIIIQSSSSPPSTPSVSKSSSSSSFRSSLLSYLSTIVATFHFYSAKYSLVPFLFVCCIALVPIIICAGLYYNTYMQNTPLRGGGLLVAFGFELLITYVILYIQRRLIVPIYHYSQTLITQPTTKITTNPDKTLSSSSSSLPYSYYILLSLVYLTNGFLCLVLIFTILGGFVSMGRIIPLVSSSSESTTIYDPPLWSILALSSFGLTIQLLWITVAGDIGINILTYIWSKLSMYLPEKYKYRTTKNKINILSSSSPTKPIEVENPITVETLANNQITNTNTSQHKHTSTKGSSICTSLISCSSRNCRVCLRGNWKPFPLGFALFLLTGIIIASITGLIQGHDYPTLKYTTIPLARLPSSLNGFRITAITDTHIGPAIGGTKLNYAIDLAISTSPDIIVLVGDIIDGDEVLMRPALDSLRKLGQYCNYTYHQQHHPYQRSCQGVYYVSGNHCSDIGTLRDKLLLFQYEYGITILHNKLISIGLGSSNNNNTTSMDDTFDLVGVPDWTLSRTSKDEINHPSTSLSRLYPPVDPLLLAPHDLFSTVKNRNTSRELIVLAHQPAHGSQAAEVGTGLLISGHVHGGQFTPIHTIAKASNKFFRGLEQATREETDYSNPQPMYAYTSYGTYQWGPLVRQFAPNEVSVLDLQSTR